MIIGRAETALRFQQPRNRVFVVLCNAIMAVVLILSISYYTLACLTVPRPCCIETILDVRHVVGNDSYLSACSLHTTQQL